MHPDPPPSSLSLSLSLSLSHTHTDTRTNTHTHTHTHLPILPSEVSKPHPPPFPACTGDRGQRGPCESSGYHLSTCTLMCSNGPLSSVAAFHQPPRERERPVSEPLREVAVWLKPASRPARLLSPVLSKCTSVGGHISSRVQREKKEEQQLSRNSACVAYIILPLPAPHFTLVCVKCSSNTLSRRFCSQRHRRTNRKNGAMPSALADVITHTVSTGSFCCCDRS